MKKYDWLELLDWAIAIAFAATVLAFVVGAFG